MYLTYCRVTSSDLTIDIWSFLGVLCSSKLNKTLLRIMMIIIVYGGITFIHSPWHVCSVPISTFITILTFNTKLPWRSTFNNPFGSTEFSKTVNFITSRLTSLWVKPILIHTLVKLLETEVPTHNSWVIKWMKMCNWNNNYEYKIIIKSLTHSFVCFSLQLTPEHKSTLYLNFASSTCGMLSIL